MTFTDDDQQGIRLQKVLAAAGIGSRRACEELIEAGRVTVDGKKVTEQGMRVDPDQAVITVDGARISTRTDAVYLVLNKPRGVVSTMSDPEGRMCVGDFVAERTDRLFHVGRLDTDTEGLILLTNDGELAHRLTHPSFGVSKVYMADVPGPIARDIGTRLKKGVQLEDGPAKVDSFRLLDSANGRALVELTVHEGRTHLVRRLLDEVGLPVARLVRTEIGPVTTGNLMSGRLRHLTSGEVGALLSAGDKPARPKAAKRPTGPKKRNVPKSDPNKGKPKRASAS